MKSTEIGWLVRKKEKNCFFGRFCVSNQMEKLSFKRYLLWTIEIVRSRKRPVCVRFCVCLISMKHVNRWFFLFFDLKTFCLFRN